MRTLSNELVLDYVKLDEDSCWTCLRCFKTYISKYNVQRHLASSYVKSSRPTTSYVNSSTCPVAPKRTQCMDKSAGQLRSNMPLMEEVQSMDSTYCEDVEMSSFETDCEISDQSSEELDNSSTDSEIDIDSFSSDMDKPLYDGCPINKSEHLTAVLAFITRHSCNQRMTTDLLHLIRLHCSTENSCEKTWMVFHLRVRSCLIFELITPCTTFVVSVEFCILKTVPSFLAQQHIVQDLGTKARLKIRCFEEDIHSLQPHRWKMRFALFWKDRVFGTSCLITNESSLPALRSMTYVMECVTRKHTTLSHALQ
ncbi:uncharacterized protein LOC134191801 [Corticium candelabrum]|uniref:uncharacterized protein LOC134191801 n=1 Tax=Corticium candelabrum TaxID=121492 RepID=UPI002E25FCB6|nr:uncharacterized protein LOC134191801 [Corticium candelabrum]